MAENTKAEELIQAEESSRWNLLDAFQVEKLNFLRVWNDWSETIAPAFKVIKSIWYFPVMRAEHLDTLASWYRKGQQEATLLSQAVYPAYQEFLKLSAPWATKVRERAKDLFHYLQSNVRRTVRNTLKRDFTVRGIALFFLFALILGVAIKSLASERFTIGYQDYLLPPAETLVDLNLVQKQVLGQGGSLSPAATVTPGEKCTE